jgi:hypothetical protein
MTRYVVLMLLFALPAAAAPPDRTLSFTRLWTHSHATPGQLSEIPAFDRRTNTVWVAGVVGVDVLNGDTGALVQHIDVTSYGLVNSVAIHNGLAALAIEAGPPDRRRPGVVVFYDTRTRQPIGDPVTVGSLPDMLTFTHDGTRLLVANEATPNAVADTAYTAPDPPGSVSIIDVETRTIIATAGFDNVPQFGTHFRTNVGMDFEPEYVAVDQDGARAFVTLQEGNAIAVLDLTLNAFTEIIGLGAKDFSLPGHEFDPRNDNVVNFINASAFGLYMPDGIASYRSRGQTFLVMANEGDFREDNADRAIAGNPPYSAAAPLDRLRISSVDSSPGNLYAAGARSMSIRAVDGTLVYDSGRILDTDSPARTTLSFSMVVTAGDLSPEGLAAFGYRGNFYLAIANEVAAAGTTGTHTTLYRIDQAKH